MRIFDLPEQANTFVEIDLDEEWEIGGKQFTKAAWTPFEGLKVTGAVHRVVIRGEVVFVEGQVIQ